ncbi:hypothetical protein CPSG_07364 [Coccidioides posadasii str. Silveira]|uniref:Uncharacterized protein n=1 Tax=Coccidioides posadasii (strain RMSCC 757 / Silveira) TaxID=443226 RepID=E9DC12_COCPS|nr:hypothetical protein CPSG_07364 [Coccidioides posadasii str. Silveira]
MPLSSSLGILFFRSVVFGKHRSCPVFSPPQSHAFSSQLSGKVIENKLAVTVQFSTVKLKMIAHDSLPRILLFQRPCRTLSGI